MRFQVWYIPTKNTGTNACRHIANIRNLSDAVMLCNSKRSSRFFVMHNGIAIYQAGMQK